MTQEHLEPGGGSPTLADKDEEVVVNLEMYTKALSAFSFAPKPDMNGQEANKKASGEQAGCGE